MLIHVVLLDTADGTVIFVLTDVQNALVTLLVLIFIIFVLFFFLLLLRLLGAQVGVQEVVQTKSNT